MNDSKSTFKKVTVFLIGGMPASGKSTFGKQVASALNRPFLDKDTVCDQYTNFVIKRLTGKDNDRDSDLYKHTLRDLEYEILLTITKEQIGLGLSPVVVAPFSTEFVSENKIQKIKDYLTTEIPSAEIITVLVKNDITTVKQQMISRKRLEDEDKLQDWDNYSSKKLSDQTKMESLVDVIINPYDSLEKNLALMGESI